MKIKKLSPEQITDKTLGYKECRKILKPALKMMISKHNTVETATKFIIKTNFEYSDMPGKKLGLLIPGDHNAAWLKLAKEEIKSDKKNTCIGECFVKTKASGGYTLVLVPIKGAAKKNLMQKQLLKSALKGIPFDIEISAGGELEEDKAEEAIVEDVDIEEGPDDEIEEEEDEEDAGEQASTPNLDFQKIKNAMAQRMAKMAAEIEKVKTQLKL